MSKTKIITLIVIFVTLMLPMLIMMYGFMFFDAHFSKDAQQVALILFVIGFWSDFLIAGVMD